jgi:hypothetical protein
MSENDVPLEDVGELAERAIDDKRGEIGSEDEARELYDVPSQSPGTLARESEQHSEGGRNARNVE